MNPIAQLTLEEAIQQNVPFSSRVREGTKKAHREAEHAPFIQDFFRGKVSLVGYREYILQLYFIYTALEKAQEREDVRAALGPLFTPSLFRRDALAHDLNALFGHPAWNVFLPLPATQAYVQHIRDLERAWPLGLVAHHYTRYLGDLSGGQVLKRVAEKTYRFEHGQGLAFYDFPLIEDPTSFKQAYRHHLDTLPLGEEEELQLVEEANRAFHFNRKVFEELGTRPGA